MASKTEHIIKGHGLRLTDQRLTLVKIFQEAEHALNYKELSSKLPSSFDRVTIYRNLKSFEEKGLIHAIPNADGELHYALCKHEHEEQHDHASHAHFKCTSCDRIECLDDNINFQPNVPKGYHTESYRLMISGLCRDCNQ